MGRRTILLRSCFIIYELGTDVNLSSYLTSRKLLVVNDLVNFGVLGLVESSRDKKAVLIELVEFLPCVCCNSEFAHCLCIKYTTFLATRNVIERPPTR